MNRCPHCGAALDDSLADGALCPSCGKVVRHAKGTTRAEAEPHSTDTFDDAQDGFGMEAYTPAPSDGEGPPDPFDHRPGTRTTTVEEIRTLWGEALSDESCAEGRIRTQGQTGSICTQLSVKEKMITQAGEPGEAPPDFEVMSLLGEGGMGLVYEARQASVDRTIALKMIKPHLAASPQQRNKFLAEAAVTSDLDHPNIVPIHDLGTGPEGRLYYAMKRVQGTAWSKVIETNSTERNLEILLSVANAIAFAHAKGVIHRDLKPQNIMIGPFGEVFVMDWGLAAAFKEGAKADPLTRQTAAGGTPAYMAPEMARADTETIGPCSDIYQLGAMLYEVITGYPPHTGDRVIGCLVNAANNRIRPTSVRGELMDIALKAMATLPADRYESVQAFQDAIRGYQSHVESIRLCERAETDLEKAQRTEEYADFARCVFALQEAIGLWEGNERAVERLAVAQYEYASCAFAKGDLDLATSCLQPDHPDHARLIDQVQRAQAERAARVWRLRILRRVAVSLAAAVILILTVAYVLIRQENARALAAEGKARQEQERAEAEAQRAEAARLAEAKQRGIAEAEKERALAAQREEAKQRAIAELATAKAKKEEEKAVAALEALIQARSREEEAQAKAKAAELVATKAESALARTGMLLDSSWWTFDAKTARARQRKAAQVHGLPVQREVTLGQGERLDLALIPAGAFVMGSPAQEAKRAGGEYLHRVELTTPYYLSRREVTLAQWRAVIGSLPHGARADAKMGSMPVTDVSWHDVQKGFLPAVNRLAPDGWSFRLPTEAEWEYACRAGTSTAFYQGSRVEDLAKVGWYVFNSNRQIHAVGQKAANPWGLYDMHGNVAEWCEDAYDSNYYLSGAVKNPVNRAAEGRRVSRGGACLNLAEHCRSAYRSWAHSNNHYKFLGFRVALARSDRKAMAAGRNGKDGR